MHACLRNCHIFWNTHPCVMLCCAPVLDRPSILGKPAPRARALANRHPTPGTGLGLLPSALPCSQPKPRTRQTHVLWLSAGLALTPVWTWLSNPIPSPLHDCVHNPPTSLLVPVSVVLAALHVHYQGRLVSQAMMCRWTSPRLHQLAASEVGVLPLNTRASP
jgi:hypothetical protein